MRLPPPRPINLFPIPNPTLPPRPQAVSLHSLPESVLLFVDHPTVKKHFLIHQFDLCTRANFAVIA